MNLQEKILAAVEPSLEYKGYEVVRTRIVKQGQRLIVSIDIDRLDGKPVSIDDCTEANHTISALLDVEDFIKSSYTLEVGSPGEFRPLTKISDFERFTGRSIKVELAPLGEIRRVTGKLCGVEKTDDDTYIICVKPEGSDEVLKLPYGNIKKTSMKRVE